MYKKAQVKIILVVLSLVILTFFLISFNNFGEKELKEKKESILHSQTASTDTYKNPDGTYTKILYSGIRNVYEDDKWKKVENARSLKDKGFNVIYLENDSEFKLDIIDFNLTSITLNLNADEKHKNKNIPVRIWKLNQTKSEQYDKDIKEGKKIKKDEDYKERHDKILDKTERFDLLSFDKRRTYEFSMDSILEFGFNSTTIKLQENETENLEDAKINEGIPIQYTGADVLLIKLNMSSIPGGSSIESSSLNLYMYSTFGAVDGDLNIYRIANQTWTEDDSGTLLNSTLLNDKTDLNSTQTITTTTSEWKSLNVTTQVKNEFEALNSYVTLSLEDQDYTYQGTGTPFVFGTSDTISIGHQEGPSSVLLYFRSKEYTTDTSLRPYLNITYSGPNLIVNTPIDNQEILNTLQTTLNTSQDNYNHTVWYSYSNGIKNYTLCTDSNECQAIITFPRQGTYNLTVYANKSDGTETSNLVTDLFVGNQTIMDLNTHQSVMGAFADEDTDDNPPPPNSLPPVGFVFVDETANAELDFNDGDLQCFAGAEIAESCGGVSGDNYPAGLFNVSIPYNKSIITEINWSVDVMYLDGTSILHMYFWNYSSTQWVSQQSGVSIGIWENISTNIGDYVSNSNVSTLLFHHDDSFGDFGIDYFSFTVTSQTANTAPTPTLVTINTQNFSSQSIDLTYNLTDDNDYVINSTLFLNGISNGSTTYPTLDSDINFSRTLSDGDYNWSVQVCDSDDSCTTSAIQNFTIDSINPSINIDYPSDYQSFNYKDNIQVNFTRSDSGIGIDSCWWSNSSGAINYTLTSPLSENITLSEIGDGDYITTVWCNDSLNNLNSDLIHYTISLTAPAVSIDYPPIDTWFSSGTSLSFNVTATDSNGIDQCQFWGNWTGWHLNQTNSTPITSGVEYEFTQTIPEGFYKFNFWCNDTTGASNWGTSNFTFGVDETFPLINLTSPLNISYTSVQTILNYTKSDTNIDSCWYSTDDGATNSSPTSCNNFTGLNSGQGSSTWTIYINDSANNQNSSSIDFFVDSINPLISYTTNTEPNNTYINQNFTYLNVSVTETNEDTITFNLFNSTHDSYNSTSFTDNSRTINWTNLADGVYYYNVTINDTLNNKNNTNTRKIILDTTYPIISNISVTETTGSQTITFDHNVSDTNLNTCKYSIFDSTGSIDGLYENVSIICSASGTSATVSAYGTYNLTIYAIDLAGNENSTTKSFTTTASSGTPKGGGGITIIEGVSSIEAINFSITTLNFGNRMDFSLAKGSKKPRQKDFYISNSGIEPIEVEVICDTQNVNESSKEVDICKYVTFSQTNFTVSPNAEERSKGTIKLLTPDGNVSFDDQFFFNILAVRKVGEETRYSKLSVSSRVSFLATLFYKWGSISGFGSQSVVEGGEERQIIYPISVIALIVSFLVFLGIFFLFHKLEKTLTGFFISTILFVLTYLGLVLLL